jgi:hypothetical protein
MEEVCERANLKEALRQVRGNKGSAGAAHTQQPVQIGALYRNTLGWLVSGLDAGAAGSADGYERVVCRGKVAHELTLREETTDWMDVLGGRAIRKFDLTFGRLRPDGRTGQPTQGKSKGAS